MIKFTSLSLKNFLSYGAEPTLLVLDRPGTTLIVGEDLDNTASGSGANGVGKSAIINAISYALYDKAISNISKDNLVNNINKKHMEVIVNFTKGGNEFRVRRVRKAKTYAAGNFVELFENGVDITPDSVANTNKKIEEILGLPYELFVRIVVFSATHVPFLDLPVRSTTGPNQTDIIEELFDLKSLSHKATTLKEHIREIEIKIDNISQRNELLDQEAKRHDDQLASAQRRVESWEKNRVAQIEEIKAKLERVSDIDIDQQREYHEQLLRLDSELDNGLKTQKKLQKDISAVVKEQKKTASDIKVLEDDKCPTCLQQYEGAKEKISDYQTKLEELQQASDDLSTEYTELVATTEAWQEQRSKVVDKITVSDLQELMEIKTKSSEYERKISELEQARNPFIEPLEELEQMKLEKPNYDKSDALIKKRDHMKFLLQLLTKKDSFVRRALLNKNLPFLNQRLQHYLTELGLSHQVEFTHEMTANITQLGRVMDFGNLSNGQRARVNIALSFAFRDVLQSLHQRINICMLDEVLDVGLDSVGVTAAARMLKRKARDENLSLYIISHRDEIDSAFDRTMTVQLKEGFSNIVEEEND